MDNTSKPRFGVDLAETLSRFTPQDFTDDKTETSVGVIADACGNVAQAIMANAPMCPERTLALRWLYQTFLEAQEAVKFG